MAKGKSSNSEIKATTFRFVSAVDAIARVLQVSVKWGGICTVAFFIYKCIASLSGQTTVADIGLKVLASMTLSKTVSYTLAGGAACWALGERTLRKKTVAKLSERLTKHETEIDTNRSSSKLPMTGNTRTEDL
jgi:hypothetical protein